MYLLLRKISLKSIACFLNAILWLRPNSWFKQLMEMRSLFSFKILKHLLFNM